MIPVLEARSGALLLAEAVLILSVTEALELAPDILALPVEALAAVAKLALVVLNLS